MNYTEKTNNGHKYAQTHVTIFDDNSVVMVSYTTPVIRITPEGWLSCNGLYSMTTIKHLGWFARMLGTTYQTLKQILMDEKEMNIHTGEVRDWA